MKEDYYKTLGVSKGSTAAEIKKAYRKMAIKYHPSFYIWGKTSGIWWNRYAWKLELIYILILFHEMGGNGLGYKGMWLFFLWS